MEGVNEGWPNEGMKGPDTRTQDLAVVRSSLSLEWKVPGAVEGGELQRRGSWEG